MCAPCFVSVSSNRRTPRRRPDFDSDLVQTFAAMMALGLVGLICLVVAICVAVGTKPHLMRRWIPVVACFPLFGALLWMAATGQELPGAAQLGLVALAGLVIWGALPAARQEQPSEGTAS